MYGVDLHHAKVLGIGFVWFCFKIDMLSIKENIVYIDYFLKSHMLNFWL